MQQEGTEAAGLFLADAGNRQEAPAGPRHLRRPWPAHLLEALIRTQAVAGAPNATSIVATRLIHP